MPYFLMMNPVEGTKKLIDHFVSHSKSMPVRFAMGPGRWSPEMPAGDSNA
jgi:hypothetical protein